MVNTFVSNFHDVMFITELIKIIKSVSQFLIYFLKILTDYYI